MKKKLLMVAVGTLITGGLLVGCGNANNEEAPKKVLNKFNFEAATSMNLLAKFTETTTFTTQMSRNKPNYNVEDYQDKLDEELLSYLQNTILKEADQIISGNETIKSTIYNFSIGEELVYLDNLYNAAIKINFNDGNNSISTYTFIYNELDINKTAVEAQNILFDHNDEDEEDNDEEDDKDDIDDDNDDIEDDKDDIDDVDEDKDDNEDDDIDDDKVDIDDVDEEKDDNEDDEEDDEIEDEKNIDGFAYLGDLDLNNKQINSSLELLPFESQTEKESNEFSREFKIITAKNSYIKVSEEKENNESEFTYLIVNNNVKDLEYSVSLETSENVNVVEIEIDNVEYTVAKHTFGNEVLYMVEIQKLNQTLKQIFVKNAEGNFVLQGQ